MATATKPKLRLQNRVYKQVNDISEAVFIVQTQSVIFTNKCEI